MTNEEYVMSDEELIEYAEFRKFVLDIVDEYAALLIGVVNEEYHGRPVSLATLVNITNKLRAEMDFQVHPLQ